MKLDDQELEIITGSSPKCHECIKKSKNIGNFFFFFDVYSQFNMQTIAGNFMYKL